MTEKEIVDAYFRAWMDPHDGARREHLRGAWADGGVYTDPTVYVEGREALVHHIGSVHEQLPGLRLIPTSGLDLHHGHARVGWKLMNASGEEVAAGVDFMVFDDDRRLKSVVGFFGPPPAQ